MAAINDVTGDELRSKTTSKLYETNYDNIFRKRKESADILIVDDPEVPSNKPMESTCNHKFRYDGHGHNYDVYKCERCGILEER